MRHPRLLAPVAFTVAPLHFGSPRRRRITTLLSEPEKEIKAFEAADRTKSAAEAWFVVHGVIHHSQVDNAGAGCFGATGGESGVGGSEVVDITHFADRIVFPYEPKIIFFRCGGNDIANGKSPEQVFADFKEFVALVRTKLTGHGNCVYVVELRRLLA